MLVSNKSSLIKLKYQSAFTVRSSSGHNLNSNVTSTKSFISAVLPNNNPLVRLMYECVCLYWFDANKGILILASYKYGYANYLLESLNFTLEHSSQIDYIAKCCADRLPF